MGVPDCGRVVLPAGDLAWRLYMDIVMTDRETMKLALEAISALLYNDMNRVEIAMNAIAALRQALEQPDPVEAAVLAEREACAKVCEEWGVYEAMECAAAIRERMK